MIEFTDHYDTLRRARVFGITIPDEDMARMSIIDTARITNAMAVIRDGFAMLHEIAERIEAERTAQHDQWASDGHEFYERNGRRFHDPNCHCYRRPDLRLDGPPLAELVQRGDVHRVDLAPPPPSSPT